jgi:hypothetical protein
MSSSFVRLGRQNPVLSVSLGDTKFPVANEWDHDTGVVAFAFAIVSPPLSMELDFDYRVTLGGEVELLWVYEHDVRSQNDAEIDNIK